MSPLLVFPTGIVHRNFGGTCLVAKPEPPAACRNSVSVSPVFMSSPPKHCGWRTMAATSIAPMTVQPNTDSRRSSTVASISQQSRPNWRRPFAQPTRSIFRRNAPSPYVHRLRRKTESTFVRRHVRPAYSMCGDVEGVFHCDQTSVGIDFQSHGPSPIVSSGALPFIDTEHGRHRATDDRRTAVRCLFHLQSRHWLAT